MAATAHSQDTTFTWVSTDGNPNDFTATLILDAPSSSSGGLADVVSLSMSSDLGVTWSGPLNADWGIYTVLSWNTSTITYIDVYGDDSYIHTVALGTQGISDTGFWSALGYTVTLSASPVNGGTVIGGGTFASGTSDTVTATANSGYTFANWTQNGSVISTSASYTFTVTGNETLVANFAADSITITSVVITPTSVSGVNTFISTDTITLTAITSPATPNVPIQWTVVGLIAASGIQGLPSAQVQNTDSTGISTFSFSPAAFKSFVQNRSSFWTSGTRNPNPPIAFEVLAEWDLNRQAFVSRLSQTTLGPLLQDEIDTLRQEYVDYRTIYQGGSYIPQRSDVVTSLGKNAPLKYNGGNYGVQLAGWSRHRLPDNTAGLPRFDDNLWRRHRHDPRQSAQISINGGYRNPQYNKAISKYPKTSIHMFGGALDLVPEPPRFSSTASLKTVLTSTRFLYPALQQAAAPYGTAFAEYSAIPVPLGCNECHTITNSNGKLCRQ